jgi:hypothetical protein
MNDNIRNLLRSYDKYAATGKYDMPDLRNFVNDLNSQFTDNDRIAAKSSLLRDLPLAGTSQVTRRTGGSDYFPGEGRPPPMPPPGMQPMVEPLPPPTEPMTRTYDKFRPQVMPPLMMEQPTPPPRKLSGLALEGLKNASSMKEPTPPLQNLGQVLQRIQQKQPPVDRGFIDRMPRMNVPEGPPPAGMAPVDPNKAMMMKHGGRAAMSKGKR